MREGSQLGNTPPAEGWWLASDGKWYPPAAAPGPAPPAYPQAALSPQHQPYPTQPPVEHAHYGAFQHQVLVANASKSPGMAIASMVLGIGAVFVALIPVVGFASIPFALVGLGLGAAGINRSRNGYEGLGLAITGVITCIAALIISLGYLLVFRSATDELSETFGDAPTEAFSLEESLCGQDGPMSAAYVGQFTNRTDRRRDFSIRVAFRTADGETATGTDNTGSLNPGETQPVKVTGFVRPDGRPVTCTVEKVRFDGQ